MMTTELRRLVQATPFRPFRLNLADGRKIDVPHPEYILILHHQPAAIIERPEGYTEFVNLPIVVSIEWIEASNAA